MNYVIVNTLDLGDLDQEQFLTEFDLSRKNEDGSKCVLKYTGDTPSSLPSIVYEGPYTQEQITQLMATSTWEYEPPEPEVVVSEVINPPIEYDPSV